MRVSPNAADDDEPPPLVCDSDDADGDFDDDAASDDGPPSLLNDGSDDSSDYGTDDSPPPLVDDDDETSAASCSNGSIEGDTSDRDGGATRRERPRGTTTRSPNAPNDSHASSTKVGDTWYCTWRIPWESTFDNWDAGSGRRQMWTDYVDVGEMWDNLGGTWDADSRTCGLTPVQHRARVLMYPIGDSSSSRGYTSLYLQMKQFNAVSDPNGTGEEEWVESGHFFERFAYYQIAAASSRDCEDLPKFWNDADVAIDVATGSGGSTFHRFTKDKKSHGWSDFAKETSIRPKVDPDGFLHVTAKISTLKEYHQFFPDDRGKHEEVSSGRFAWHADNVRSFLPMMKRNKVTSPVFRCGVHETPLQVSMYESDPDPESGSNVGPADAGGKKRDPNDPSEKVSQLSICLEVAEPSAKERRSARYDPFTKKSQPTDNNNSCWLLFRVTLHNQVDGKASVHRDFFGRLSQNPSVDGGAPGGLGARAFIPMKDFVESGYLGTNGVHTSITVTFHALREATEAKTSSWYADPGQCIDREMAAAAARPGGPTVGARLATEEGRNRSKPGYDPSRAIHAPLVKGVAGGIPDDGRVGFIKGKRPKGQRPQDNSDNGRMQCVGRFVWRIDKFNKLKDVLKKRKMNDLDIKSPQFNVGGHNMRLKMYPRGQGNPPTHMSLFLEVTPPQIGFAKDLFRLDNSTVANWSCFVSHKLTLINQKDVSKSIDKETQSRFDLGSKNWGWKEFAPLTQVFDDSAGFLVDDCLVLAVETLVMAEAAEAAPGPRLWTPPRALWHFDPLTPKGRASTLLNVNFPRVFDLIGFKAAPDDEHYLDLGSIVKDAVEDCRCQCPGDAMFDGTWDPTLEDPDKVYPDWEYAAKDDFCHVNEARSIFAACCQLDWMDAEGMLDGTRRTPGVREPRLWKLLGIALSWDEAQVPADANAEPGSGWFARGIDEMGGGRLIAGLMELLTTVFDELANSELEGATELAEFMMMPSMPDESHELVSQDVKFLNSWRCFFRMLRIMAMQYVTFQFPHQCTRAIIVDHLRAYKPGTQWNSTGALWQYLYERRKEFVVPYGIGNVSVSNFPHLLFFFRWVQSGDAETFMHLPYGQASMDFTWKIDNFSIFRDVIEQQSVFTNEWRCKDLVHLKIVMKANNGQLCFKVKIKPGKAATMVNMKTGAYTSACYILSYRIAVMNAKQPSKTRWLTGKILTGEDYRDEEYMPLATLLDRESGFLQKDSITVQLCVVDIVHYREPDTLDASGEAPEVGVAAPEDGSMPDGSDDSHNTIARERDLQVSQMMPDAKAIKDGAALIRTGQQLQAAAKSDEFFESVVPEYSKRLLKKVIGEMGGLDLGTMTQHLDELGDRLTADFPEDVRSRMAPSLNAAMDEIRRNLGIEGANAARQADRGSTASNGRIHELPPSTPMTVVSGDAEKEFIDILGKHRLGVKDMKDLPDQSPPEHLIKLWQWVRCILPPDGLKVSSPWIWDEPDPRERLTHDAWGSEALPEAYLASDPTPTKDACFLLTFVLTAMGKDGFNLAKSFSTPGEANSDHRAAFRKLVETNGAIKKDAVLALHRLFRDSYTIWRVFGGAGNRQSFRFFNLIRDDRDWRCGRHNTFVPASGEQTAVPDEWSRLVDILKLFMSVECLRGFVFAQLLRAMKEVWHLSTHQFFPKHGQWPKDRTMPTDFDYPAHAVNPEAFWPDHTEFAKSEGIFEDLVFFIVELLVDGHDVQIVDERETQTPEDSNTKSTPDHDFDKKLDEYVGYAILCETARLAIHIKHLRVNQNNPRTKISEFVADVCPSPAHLVFHRIIFHIPKFTPTAKHLELSKMLQGLANPAAEVIETQCRYLDLIGGVGLDGHDSALAEKLRGRGCGRPIMIDPNWWRNTAFLGELTEYEVDEDYWMNTLAKLSEENDLDRLSEVKMRRAYMGPLRTYDERHDILSPHFGTIRPEDVRRIRGVYFEAMRGLILDERSGENLVDSVCGFVKECRYPETEHDAALAACLEVNQSFKADMDNILRVCNMMWERDRYPLHSPVPGKTMCWVLQQAMARNPTAASVFAAVKFKFFDVRRRTPVPGATNQNPLLKIDLSLLFECCRYPGVMVTPAGYGTAQQAIDAINMGLDINYFTPCMVRDELRKWLLESLRTVRQRPFEEGWKPSGRKFDNWYASVGRSRRMTFRTDGEPQNARVAGGPEGENVFQWIVSTVIGIAEKCLRDKDGTPRTQKQRVSETEMDRGSSPRSFAKMSEAAREKFAEYDINLSDEDGVDWVHLYGVYKDIFEIFDHPKLARGDSPLATLGEAEEGLDLGPVSAYTWYTGDQYDHDPLGAKVDMINIIFSISTFKGGFNENGLLIPSFPRVRALAMLLAGEPFVDLRPGFHINPRSIEMTPQMNWEEIDPKLMLVHLKHPKRFQVGHVYNYARHVTPDHWRQFVDDETTVNIAFAVAHLYNGLCRIQAAQLESEELLSNTRLKHDQLNASIAEKAAELAKERKEMQAKLVDQEKKLEKAVANHNRDIATLTDGKKTAEANFRTAQSQLEISRADSDRNTKEWTKEKKELETRVKELEFNVTKLKKEKASAAQAQELKTANQRVTAAQGETRKKEQELAAARTNAAKFEREAEEATADNRELREKVKELKAELKGAQQAAAKSQAAAAARPAPQSTPGPDPALQMKLKQTEEELDKVNRQFRQERARMNGLCGNHLENPSVSDQDLAALQTVHKKGLIALADEWHRRRLPFEQWTLREGLAEPYFTQQPPAQQPHVQQQQVQQSQVQQQPQVQQQQPVQQQPVQQQSYQAPLRSNPYQSQADRGLGPAVAPIGGAGSGPSSAVGSPARSGIAQRMASMGPPSDFFGAPNAADDDSLLESMISEDAGGENAGGETVSETENGFPKGSRFSAFGGGLGNGTWGGGNSTWR